MYREDIEREKNIYLLQIKQGESERPEVEREVNRKQGVEKSDVKQRRKKKQEGKELGNQRDEKKINRRNIETEKRCEGWEEKNETIKK